MDTARKIEQPNPEITPDELAQLRQTLDKLSNRAGPPQRSEGDTARPAARRRPKKGRAIVSTPQQAPTADGSNLSNQPKFEELLAKAEARGLEQAQGEDVQIKFALEVANAANSGVVDLTPNKHGPGIDDAHKLSGAYAKGRNRAVIFNHKEPKQKKLGSTTRLCIKFGSTPKFRSIEILDDLLATRAGIRRKDKVVKLTDGTQRTLPAGSRRLDDAFNTVTKFMRAQLKKDTAMDFDEYVNFCFKSEREARTVEDWWKQVHKQALQISKGKSKAITDTDNSPMMKALIQCANTRMVEIAKEKGAKQAA